MRFWKGLSEWCSSHAHFVIALAATLIGLFLFAYADISENRNAAFVFLKDIEQRSLDLRFALRGKREADPRIVIVGIDEKTLQEVGSFPLPRSSYAVLVRNLKQDGAQVIAFDEDFSQPASSEALAVLSKLKQDLGKHATPQQTQELQRLWQQADVDTQFANALRMPGTSCSVTCSSTPIAPRLSIRSRLRLTSISFGRRRFRRYSKPEAASSISVRRGFREAVQSSRASSPTCHSTLKLRLPMDFLTSCLTRTALCGARCS